jgi:periplasmic protein CpxP/Spy
MARPLALNRSNTIRAAIFVGGIVCGAGLAALVAAGTGERRPPVAAETAAAASPPASSQPAGPALSPEARAAVDQRIDELRLRLGVTPDQLPLWSAFAEAMRDNAARTDALFARRAGAVTAMSAVENMDSYAAIARAYADNTERLAEAFDRLYASLSDTQKQAADALFREQATAAAKPQAEH